jgi:tetratricopeptide (TPR) repeat protein
MPARACLLLLVGLLITGAQGCATLPGSAGITYGEGAAVTGRKRQARPSTYVAFGELHEKAATEPGRSPAEQEELRNKARLAYQQALKINPKDQPALRALARLYIDEGDYEHALATYNQALQAYAKDAVLRYELGMFQARRKNWDLALQNLQQAVQLDPENRRYRHDYGLCLARAQRYDESFAVLVKLEGPANARYDLARMMHHLEQDEASKEQLRLALAQDRQLIEAQQLLDELEAASPNPANPIIAAGAESPSEAAKR